MSQRPGVSQRPAASMTSFALAASSPSATSATLPSTTATSRCTGAPPRPSNSSAFLMSVSQAIAFRIYNSTTTNASISESDSVQDSRGAAGHVGRTLVKSHPPTPTVILPPRSLRSLGGAFAPGFALRARATAHAWGQARPLGRSSFQALANRTAKTGFLARLQRGIARDARRSEWARSHSYVRVLSRRRGPAREHVRRERIPRRVHPIGAPVEECLRGPNALSLTGPHLQALCPL